MCNGIEIVNKIYILLEEFGISQKNFSKQIGLSQSTIPAWKTRNIVPPLETLGIIAENLEISIEWLVTKEAPETISYSQRILLTRRQIRKRIYQTISEKINEPDADNERIHNCFFTNMPNLTYRKLYNWAEGRVNLNEYILVDIAYTLGISVEYLMSGNQNEGITFDSNDLHILDTAKRNLNDLFCLDNLTGKRRQLAKDMLNQLMELEHLEYVEKQNAEKKE